MKKEIKSGSGRVSDMNISLLTDIGELSEEVIIQQQAKTEGRKTSLTIAEFKKIDREVAQEEEDEVPFSQKSVVGKIFFIVLFPLNLIGIVTLPPVELERIKNPLVCFYCLTGPLAFVFLRGCKHS